MGVVQLKTHLCRTKTTISFNRLQITRATVGSWLLAMVYELLAQVFTCTSSPLPPPQQSTRINGPIVARYPGRDMYSGPRVEHVPRRPPP